VTPRGYTSLPPYEGFCPSTVNTPILPINLRIRALPIPIRDSLPPPPRAHRLVAARYRITAAGRLNRPLWSNVVLPPSLSLSLLLILSVSTIVRVSVRSPFVSTAIRNRFRRSSCEAASVINLSFRQAVSVSASPTIVGGVTLRRVRDNNISSIALRNNPVRVIAERLWALHWFYESSPVRATRRESGSMTLIRFP